MWENAQFMARDDSQAYDRINEIIADDGITTRFWGPSTIPRLLENDMGTENFYYLLWDYPREMEALINTIHERELKAFEILTLGPCDVIILCENTSTFYISPEIYRKYNGPHVRDFVDIVHAAGKTAIIHMCGHVKNILDQIKNTGLDGIHGLTPSPTGDTPWELALDVLGEEQIIIGVLDPTIFLLGLVEEIASALDALYTPRLRRANFILWPAADGISVPVERFQAVADWMNRNGYLA
jgi:uroporphyrinogen-III decarboxylase